MLGPLHPDTLSSTNSVGVLLRNQGKLNEAEHYLRDALAKRRQLLGNDHLATLESINFEGAEKDLLEAHAIFVKSPGPIPTDTRDAIQAIAELYRAWQLAAPSAVLAAKSANWQRALDP